MWILGYFLARPINRIIVLGFVISLSSSAIVMNYLHNKDQIESKIGQNVIGILLVQDILVAPMMITLNYLSGISPLFIDLLMQLILGIIIWVLVKKEIRLPFGKYIRKDDEIQVFIAFAFCFGFAIITAFFGLSSSLGAFVAGIIVSSAKETIWVSRSLHAFRIVFVALFFVSVGMLINLSFVTENIGVVAITLLLAFFTNSMINAIIARGLGENWSDSLYTGAILAQIGEFSFILGASAYYLEIITDYTYQLIVSTIAISLILSPMWIFLVGKLIGFSKNKELQKTY